MAPYDQPQALEITMIAFNFLLVMDFLDVIGSQKFALEVLIAQFTLKPLLLIFKSLDSMRSLQMMAHFLRAYGFPTNDTFRLKNNNFISSFLLSTKPDQFCALVPYVSLN